MNTPYDRRGLLKCHANPSSGLDYVTKLSGLIRMHASDTTFSVVFQYVPDRLILKAGFLSDYFEELAAEEWDSIERLTTTILDDLQNELVPRWVRVEVSTNLPDDSNVVRQTTTADDGQPGWQNDAVLSRLIT